MKKKVLAICLAAIIALTAVAGASLAYLTDTDSAVNTMVMGNVNIEQHEYQRVIEDGAYIIDTIDNRDSYVLEPFAQAKGLLPMTWDVPTWDDIPVRMSQVDSYGGMSVFNNNAQDKFITVENTGKTEAYVRTLVAIECGSLDADTFDKLVGHSYHSTWTETEIGIITIDGVNYWLIEYVYAGADLGDGNWRHENGILPAGDTTYPSFSQVYLAPETTNEDCIALDGNNNGTLDILVFSQAVQAAGFENADVALDAAFGDITVASHPWLDGVSVPVTVTSIEDMVAALDAGATDLIVKGVTFDSNPLNGHYTIDINITYVDCEFTANMAWNYIKNATFTSCTFNSTGAAVHFDELKGDAVFNGCNFIAGKVQIGAGGTVTFNDCAFAETANTSIWSDKGLRVYSPTEFNGCSFANRVVLAGSADLPITFDSCTMYDAEGNTIAVYYVDNTDGIIRGGNIPAVTIIG